jgi:hypothetical protein
MPPKNEEQVFSKQGDPIHEGDHVYTKIRGGRHEGNVSSIVAGMLSERAGLIALGREDCDDQGRG